MHEVSTGSIEKLLSDKESLELITSLVSGISKGNSTPSNDENKVEKDNSQNTSDNPRISRIENKIALFNAIEPFISDAYEKEKALIRNALTIAKLLASLNK